MRNPNEPVGAVPAALLRLDAELDLVVAEDEDHAVVHPVDIHLVAVAENVDLAVDTVVDIDIIVIADHGRVAVVGIGQVYGVALGGITARIAALIDLYPIDMYADVLLGGNRRHSHCHDAGHDHSHKHRSTLHVRSSSVLVASIGCGAGHGDVGVTSHHLAQELLTIHRLVEGDGRCRVDLHGQGQHHQPHYETHGCDGIPFAGTAATALHRGSPSYGLV